MPHSIRNVAVIAHVDHGKTSVVDSLVWQSAAYERAGRDVERLARTLDPQREKTIGVMPRRVGFAHGDIRVTLLDTPGHDLSGEVERTLNLAEGVLLIVDAVEGPMPQTRYGLRRALAAGLSPLVLVNKVDLNGADPAAAVEGVREQLRDLEAGASQLEFPVLYGVAHRGWCGDDPGRPTRTMLPLLDLLVERVPAPSAERDAPFRLVVSDFGYDDFIGRTCVGKVVSGSLRPGASILRCRASDEPAETAVSGVYGFDGVQREERDRADAGEIVDLTGVDAAAIGDTLCEPGHPVVLPGPAAPQPTIALTVEPNRSPLGGSTDADSLRRRLWQVVAGESALTVEEAGDGDRFRIAGSSELQLVILVETLRREGLELQLDRPEVLARVDAGASLEPFEDVEVDCLSMHAPIVTGKLEQRLGRLTRMVDHGTGRVRMEFVVPTRGLIGFRAELLHDTRGTGLLHQRFREHALIAGEVPHRTTGSLVADRDGACTGYALRQLQHRGTLFVSPGEEVYQGRIVGENSHSGDLLVNVTKMRPGGPVGSDPTASEPLIPPRSLSTEQAIEFAAADELVEVTPRAIRLRKRTAAQRG